MEISFHKFKLFCKNKFNYFKNKIKNGNKNDNKNENNNNNKSDNKNDSQDNKYHKIINNNTIIINNIMDDSSKLNSINKETHNTDHSPNPKHKPDFNKFENINDSTYQNNIVSSVISTIIDTIQYNDNLISKHKNQEYKQEILNFYNTQFDYSRLKTQLDPNLYDEFCRIMSGIINEDVVFLQNLGILKRYNNDLIKPYTRYGVFRTKNFIIKIDDSEEIFNPELEIMYLIGTDKLYAHNVIIPQYIYFVPPNKNNTMNFSIQPLIKNSLPLHKWMRSYVYKQTPIEIYINICISISKSILYMHSYDIVHGDIKPDNILIEIDTHVPYVIDFGLSGIHGISYGTGGTKPFCCPETKNINDNIDKYKWTNNNKQYDLWSIAFIFASIIIFKNVYNNYSEYPVNYFTSNKYVSLIYLYRIPIKYRNIFILVLSKKTDIDLANFIQLLEEALQS